MISSLFAPYYSQSHQREDSSLTTHRAGHVRGHMAEDRRGGARQERHGCGVGQARRVLHGAGGTAHKCGWGAVMTTCSETNRNNPRRSSALIHVMLKLFQGIQNPVFIYHQSFLNTATAQVAKSFLVWDKELCLLFSDSLLLMAWWCRKPEHQQLWFWLRYPGIFQLQYPDWALGGVVADACSLLSQGISNHDIDYISFPGLCLPWQ